MPYFVVEQLDYQSVAPWPTDAAVADRCLARIVSTEPAYLPSNWRAEALITIHPAKPTLMVERLSETKCAFEPGVREIGDMFWSASRSRAPPRSL